MKRGNVSGFMVFEYQDGLGAGDDHAKRWMRRGAQLADERWALRR